MKCNCYSKWLCLEGLHFEDSSLDDLAFSILSKAKWRKLTYLTLSKNYFGSRHGNLGAG